MEEGKFAVSYVTREDIAQHFFGKDGTEYIGSDKTLPKSIQKITDDEMKNIASKMNDYSCDGAGYWDALEEAVIDVVGELEGSENDDLEGEQDEEPETKGKGN